MADSIAASVRPRFWRKQTRRLAATIAAMMALGGAVGGGATSAHADALCQANPMGVATPIGSENGYTVFTFGDAVLANSEFEGTLAVGGTASFWAEDGNQNRQYPIVHKVAGNADYGLPTIDGEYNRVLLQRYSPGVDQPATNTQTGKVVQVGDRNMPDNVSGPGLVKIVDQSVEGAEYEFRKSFGTDGTTFYPAGGSNMSAQLDSEVQEWKDADTARKSFSTESPFADYFPSDAGTSLLGSDSSVIDWKAPTVAGSGGDEATITLDMSGPNRINLSDIANVKKFKFQDGIAYDPCAPLVITVEPKHVVDGRLSLPSFAHAGHTAVGEGISYVLWDLSKISGDVVVTSPNEPVRGAIYAPRAHIIFPPENDGGREFEGQIVAAQLSALQGGKELHTNLFKGRLAVESGPQLGGFSLAKVVAGDGAARVGDGEFVFDVTIGGETEQVSLADGQDRSWDGLAVGTQVTITEGPVEAPAGTVFAGVSYDVDGESVDEVSFAVTGGQMGTVVATNTFTVVPGPELGGFSLAKVVAGDGADLVGDSEFLFDVTIGDQTEQVSLAGGQVLSWDEVPVGTQVTITEGPVEAPEGTVFAGVSYDVDGESVDEVSFAVIGGEVGTVVVATNTFTTDPGPQVGGFSLAKVVVGDGADRVGNREFVFDVTIGSETEQVSLADGQDRSWDGLAVGTQVTIAEQPVEAPEGTVFAGVSYVVDGEPADQVSFAVVGGEVGTVVEAANTFTTDPGPQLGGFSLAKAVVGDGADLVGDGEFVFEVTIGDQTEQVSLADGERLAWDDVPVGTQVTTTEEPVEAPEGTVFAGVSYVVDGEPVDEVSFAVTGGQVWTEVEATNTFTVEPGPATPEDASDTGASETGLATAGADLRGIVPVLLALLLTGGLAIGAARYARRTTK